MTRKMLKNKVYYKIIYRIFKIGNLMIQTIFKRQVKIKINILVFKKM